MISKRKSILIISAMGFSSKKGKGSPSFSETLKGYANFGWNVFCIISNKSKDPFYDDFFHKKYKNAKIIRFDAQLLKRILLKPKIGFIAKIIWWIYFQIVSFFLGFKIAKKEKIDIFYGYEIYGIPVAKVLSILFKKPIISRFQGTKVPFYKRYKLWKIRFFPHVLAIKISADLYIMANDGTEGETVLREFKREPKKIKFWINGLSKDIFEKTNNKEKTKKKLGFKKDDFILLSVSRLEKWKGIHRTLNVLPSIIKKHQNTKFLIIGDGSEKKNLEKLAKSLNVSENTKFLDAIPHKEIRHYYNIADIFVSMYDISNVGNPLLEAMAQGKCIVALNVGDTDKFIKNNENGVIVNKKELRRLPNIIIDLIENKRKRKKFEYNAKIFAKKNLWTWEERMNAEIKEVNKLVLKWQKK